MATLQIEHGNTDLTTWKGAFDRFEPADSGGPPRPSTGLPAAEPKGRVDEPGTRPFPGKEPETKPSWHEGLVQVRTSVGRAR